MAGGRPTDYTPEIVEKAKKYLKWCVDEVISENRVKVNIPSIEWLSVDIGVNRDTIYQWENEEGKEEFSDIIMKIRAEQANRLLNNGLSWTYNPTIAKLMLTKHWYSDKQETENKNLNIETTPQELASMTDEQLQALLK